MTKQKALVAHERGITFLKKYLSEIKFEILANFFRKITFLLTLTSTCDALLSIESIKALIEEVNITFSSMLLKLILMNGLFSLLRLISI